MKSMKTLCGVKVGNMELACPTGGFAKRRREVSIMLGPESGSFSDMSFYCFDTKGASSMANLFREPPVQYMNKHGELLKIEQKGEFLEVTIKNGKSKEDPNSHDSCNKILLDKEGVENLVNVLNSI